MGLPAELRLSDSLERFSVAVVAMDDGRFAYQVFLVCGEPRTLLIDSARYLTPDDAAQAGYEAVASISHPSHSAQTACQIFKPILTPRARGFFCDGDEKAPPERGKSRVVSAPRGDRVPTGSVADLH
jgi:hypothetical protein